MKKIFKGNEHFTEKTQYLAGWEIQLDGEEHCYSFIQTQLIDKKTAKNLGTYVELNFGLNNLLCEAKLYSDGRQETSGHLYDYLNIKGSIGKLIFKDFKTNHLYALIESNIGINYLGGETPSDFKIPENKCPGSFQYLGMLSNKDQAFDWLPFDLHLICPIYLDIDKVWIDYNDPLNPIILNKEEIDNTGSAYDELKNDSFVIFEQKNFNTIKVAERSLGFGVTGVPNWIQYPDIPMCPISKKTMKFLCQLGDYVDVKVSKTNVHPEDDWYKQYFEEMNFWSDGDLFVFFEPETKIACYFIQNS
ncbi:MAG TPA: hypothetical protein VLZ75_08525 [Chitinophagales bacterium]|nr:hypothetical protein [Chitinophagales bacterium]